MSSKYENDLAIVSAILEKPAEEITAADRARLVSIVAVSYHDAEGSKIVGLFSIDSSCHGCEFCQHMREAADGNPLHICGMCYDFRQEQYRKGMQQRHALTMRVLSSVDFTVQELAALPVPGMCRFNSSGDLVNAIHARNYIRIAMSHPFARFTLWAKNVRAAEAAFDALGKPSNMLFIQSSPIIGRPCRRSRWADYTFTVYPDEATTAAAIAAGACACNGRKCRDCGYKCYSGEWAPGSDIAELLRVGKDRRAEILAAYNAAEAAR